MAPDIAALGKPLGERCPHLTADNLCAVYENRPQICRDYAADWLCERIAAPTLEERVRKYLAAFDLEPVRGVQIVQIVQIPQRISPSASDGLPNRAR